MNEWKVSGMLAGKQNRGLGMRSWRYSMLVRDGVVEKILIEPLEPGARFTCPMPTRS